MGDSPPANVWSFGGDAALSVEARYLEPDLPDELQKAYAQTFDRLRRMFRARGCTPEEAADLAQEAAVRAFVHVRRWGVNGVGLDPLLNRIARNLLIDRYRRTTPHIVPLDDAGEIHDPTQDPTEEVVRRQRSRAVRHAIRGLPVRHQTAITYSLNGLTPEEVGRRMGIGRNAADALLHRARRSLKEKLQTAGEGMFGIALGFRVRWDRLVRRGGATGIGSPAADSVAAFSSVGLGLATAAVLAVIGVAGGGGSTSGTTREPITPAVAAVEHAVDASSAGTGPSAPGSVGAAAGSSSGSSGSGSTYNFGPTNATWGSDGFNHETTVPGPRDSEGDPFLKGTGYLYRDDDEIEPQPHDPGVMAARAVCNTLPALCRSPGSR